MGDLMRNENYQGDDLTIAAAQATADGWLTEIARLRADPPFRLSADDKLEIVELTHLWDAAYDALDLETWLSCFEPDGGFYSIGFGDFVGVEAMTGYFNTYKKAFHGFRHLLSNHIVVGLSATEARAFSYLTVFERIRGTDMLGTSPFFDQVVKRDGRWRFQRRDQVVDPGMRESPAGKALMARFDVLFADAA